MILRARYVLPVEAPAIEDGAVVIEDGRITAVGTASELATASATDYGQAAVCPGFVNAHTHLELTDLLGRVPPTADFTDWLTRLVAVRRSPPPAKADVLRTVHAGMRQSLLAGVTTIGDITTAPSWTRGALSAWPGLVVSFGEVIAIGSTRDQLARRLEEAASAGPSSGRLTRGVSPHAPYTVEPDAMQACAERARADALPICIHLAETIDEDSFTRTGTGRFRDYLAGLGVIDDDFEAPGCGPVELAVRTGLMGRATVLAHANYVDDDDLDRIGRGGASVAYCPRTHAAFGHPPHPFKRMRAAGINVCIGTDSLASNPSLSVLDELRALRRAGPEVPPDEILAMGTLCGARALGLDHLTGSIAVGKRADLVVLPIDTPAPTAGCWSILDSQVSPVAVYVGGRQQSLDRVGE